MGMFDSVIVRCPNCDCKVEFQSKAGECACSVFTFDTAPRWIMEDILNDPHMCGKCKQWFALVDPNYPPPSERAPPSPKALLCRTPEPNEVTIYQDGSFGWWEAPFSFADLKSPPNPLGD